MDDLSPLAGVRLSPRTHGTKRRSRESPKLTVRKRPRPCVDITTSLSPDEIQVLSKAATILQVELSDLAGLAKTRNLQPRGVQKDNKSQAVSEEISPQRYLSSQVSNMENMPHQSRFSTHPPKSKSKNQSDSSSATPFDSTSDDICHLPSFDLGLIPEQIADCLASFKSPTSRISLPVTPRDSTQHDMSMISTESSLLLQNRKNQGSPSYWSNDILTPQTSTGTDAFDYLDYSLQSDYACDNIMINTAECWSGRQPSPSQYIPPSSMVYHPEHDVEHREDLILFEEDLETHKIFFDDPNQGNYPRSLESNLVEFNKESTPASRSGQTTQRLTGAPRRKKLLSDDRQKTAQTRKLTACVRCRMQRIRCYPDPSNLKGSCLTCQKVTKPTMHKLPCLRYKLRDIRLFREGSYAAGREWSHRWTTNTMENITQWASAESKQIQVTQDYGDTTLTFTVREFVPVAGDMLCRQWSDGGVIKSVQIPNYAIVDMAEALQVHKDFIIDKGAQFFKSTLDYNDRLLWDTYDNAIWFSNESKSVEEKELLQMVLQLWVAIRMTTRSLRITGPETLSMPSDLMDKSSGMRGKIPIPPVMGAQMQLILNHKLQAPLRTKILTRLQKLTLEQKPDHWFCIYLCTFILLHNCSLLTIHDIGYAQKHGIKARHARPDMMKELHMGANVLLAHFHYGCKGYHPFSLDWKSELSMSMATLDERQLCFVQQTAKYVNYNESRFRKLRSEGNYDNEHYFIAQMYEEEWRPRMSFD